jgi:hypothetical protein
MIVKDFCICGHHKDHHCLSGIDGNNKACKTFIRKSEICPCIKFEPSMFNNQSTLFVSGLLEELN